MALQVTSAVLEILRREAALAYPRECCGFLLGAGNHVDEAKPARNIHPQPESYFEIDPQNLVDAHRAARSGGPQVLGYYHSHPAGPREPSTTDRAAAAHDDRVWAIVTGEGDVTFWRDDETGFVMLPYAVDHG